MDQEVVTTSSGARYALLSEEDKQQIELAQEAARKWQQGLLTLDTVPQPQAKTSNTALTKEYFQIIESLDGDLVGRRNARSYMLDSTGIVHHLVVASSFIPRLYDVRSYDVMKHTAETTHQILCKVITRYLEDPDYRSIFNYDKRLVDLILIPRGYDAVLPFARFDIFLNENDLTLGFCEFNGDGSAGMNENREITASIRESASYQEFARRHKVQECELFDAWIEEFIQIYSTFINHVDNPRFAICDYLENGVVDEFKIFAQGFEKRGIPCSVCDVREMRFDGEILTDSDGRRIDAIWRRAVTNDVIEHWDDSQDLIAAVRAQKVALIGSFAGHLVHDKQIFDALHHPKTRSFLTQEEIDFIDQTVPLTRFLNDQEIDLAEVRNNKDAWIIKPTDGYGATDVFAGCAYTQAEWNELINHYANNAAGFPFLAQRYITPFRTPVLPPDITILEQKDNEISREAALYHNLEGLYCYNGHFQGVFSRLGPYATISKPMAGITCASIFVDLNDARNETVENL